MLDFNEKNKNIKNHSQNKLYLYQGQMNGILKVYSLASWHNLILQYNAEFSMQILVACKSK